MGKIDVEEAFSVATPSEEQLGSLEQHVNKALTLQAQIDVVTEHLSTLNKEYQSIVVNAIPAAMAAANISEFKTNNGAKITIRDIINGSLPKDDKARKKAITWIEKHDGEGLIKVSIGTTFPRGDLALADKLRSQMNKMKIEFSDKEDIHPQTLASFARELIRDGKKVPLELLGLSSIRIAKIVI